jgi:hypothetical protein
MIAQGRRQVLKGGGYTHPFLHEFEKKGVAKWVPASG